MRISERLAQLQPLLLKNQMLLLGKLGLSQCSFLCCQQEEQVMQACILLCPQLLLTPIPTQSAPIHAVNIQSKT